MSSLKNAFEHAAEKNYWSDPDSLSGPGSNLIQTAVIRKEIPALLEKYQIRRMLDAPCGDLFWMKELLPKFFEKGIQYNGADIVPGLIEKHKSDFEKYNASFYTLDLTSGPIPNVDLVFTRDCFIHLSYSNIFSILKNYKKAGIKYLLLSTYTNTARVNYDVEGFYLYGRMLNMEKFPFYFPKPKELIVEGCTEGKDGEYADKSLGLWELSSLNLLGIEAKITVFAVSGTFISILRKGMSFSKRVLRKLFRS